MPTPFRTLALAVLLALAETTQASDACAQATPRPPAGAAPSAARSRWAAGSHVEVLWNGTWFPSTIVAVNPDGTYRIHYDGWSGAWDENVGPDRIR